jgi:hypothetical protein
MISLGGNGDGLPSDASSRREILTEKAFQETKKKAYKHSDFTKASDRLAWAIGLKCRGFYHLVLDISVSPPVYMPVSRASDGGIDLMREITFPCFLEGMEFAGVCDSTADTVLEETRSCRAWLQANKEWRRKYDVPEGFPTIPGEVEGD